ncbi:NADH:flavin oxidoreductase/NADH oxidase [Myceligenerans crystallogenes]|uniref:NADH:flavin oxidoreductase/NADH oxidase n=1 Tax=Myceligenerans crystallogenes TaxID=316335 RepID=A0ABP4ZI88_9MICO
MSLLFQPITVRGLTLPNRVWLAPMCQYSATDGLPGDWHLVHLGARAAGGFGLVMTEATAVVPEGRISPADTGIWNDEQTAAWRRITDFLHARGAKAGIQLAHSGRKGSAYPPFHELADTTVPASDGGWTTLGPAAEPFGGLAAPAAMTPEQIEDVPRQFAAAARRSLAAGFDVAEVHAAHGYLLHQFLSPLVNTRDDEWGGSAERRARIVRETVRAVREVWPDELPVFVRLSATDWLPEGLGVEDVAALAADLKADGADVVDVTTGGAAPARITSGPGYQVGFARRIRDVSGLPVSAVGLITQPVQAEQVLVEGAADAVMIGREALRDPHWPLRAARELRVEVPRAPVAAGVGVQAQYDRAPWR